MISFIVPAHNEAACLDRTLCAIHESARATGRRYEIVVANDASTDATPQIAQQHNARVVSVNHRQISATRNSGGRAARGDYLFFIDADTTANPHAVTAAVQAMDKGAAGGGAPTYIAWNDPVPAYIRIIVPCQLILAKLIGFTGGAFMFCTRAAFLATGGFSERVYWAEEGAFALALKRQGRFVVLWKPVLTSGRRFRKNSAWDLALGLVRMAFSPVKMTTQRSSVENIWYDSTRADENKMPNSFLARLSNAVAFILILVMISGPIWNFIPRSWTPWDTPWGNVRLVVGTFLVHLGLVFWPIAAVLLFHLAKKKHWFEWLKLAGLFAFCVWQGWGATRGVVWTWTTFYDWSLHLASR